MKAKDHNIFRLGDGEKEEFITFYNLLEKRGFSVGAVAPMNLTSKLKSPNYFIPDPWSKRNSNSKWIDILITKIIKKFVNRIQPRTNPFLIILAYFLLLLFISDSKSKSFN